MIASKIFIASALAVLVVGLPTSSVTGLDISTRDTITVPVGEVDPRTGKKVTVETTFEVDSEPAVEDESLKPKKPIFDNPADLASNPDFEDTPNPTPEQLKDANFLIIPPGEVNPKTGKKVNKETFVIVDENGNFV